jgi:hypothetical protein
MQHGKCPGILDRHFTDVIDDGVYEDDLDIFIECPALSSISWLCLILIDYD